jgi:hypothetical protein
LEIVCRCPTKYKQRSVNFPSGMMAGIVEFAKGMYSYENCHFQSNCMNLLNLQGLIITA